MSKIETDVVQRVAVVLFQSKEIKEAKQIWIRKWSADVRTIIMIKVLSTILAVLASWP